MEKIEFLVVSGFLGAGKTTTMIALAEYMDAHMQKVGIIANDLGAQLVDTNLTRESGCTVEEIASGCICYQMENTVDRIRRMRDGAGAKLVMSDIPGCGVGTVEHVYKQVLRDNSDEFWLGPLTVIVDPERLRMIMPEQADINLPPELKYLLETQVEEADLVVLNKIDKLSEPELQRYLDFLGEVCEVPVMAISARGHPAAGGVPGVPRLFAARGRDRLRRPGLFPGRRRAHLVQPQALPQDTRRIRRRLQRDRR